MSKQKQWGKRTFLTAAMAAVLLTPVAYETQQTAVASSTLTSNSSVESTSLEKKLDTILQDSKLAGGITGVTVRNRSNGAIVYSQFGDIRLRPASNMKLLTGAAAMDVLGPDYQFSTEVLMDGELKSGQLKGTLYLKGKGDPTLLKEDLDEFAKQLKAQGITKINGDLVADDSWYDNVRYSQDLNWSDEHNYVGAQVSALTLSPNDDYDAGTVIVEVNAAAKAGEPSVVTVTPATNYVEIVNNAKTVGKDEKKTISIEREHGTNRIFIEGNIPVDGTRTRSWTAVWEPTELTLDVFQKSLKEQGIQLIGNGKVKTGIAPANATVLATKKSMPLKDLYIPFMKLSNNGHAETLVKEMGRVKAGDGSWDTGLDVMKNTLKGLGLNTDSIVLRDGSGMSHKNLVSADDLSTLLYRVQDKSWFPAFEASLPVAGNEDRMIGGTLRNRMGGGAAAGNVKAKTGSITGVSTLTGYVTAKDGTELIFSVMINNYVSGPVTPIEDAIANVLAEHEF
nr:D-alanyl-D-alanine carboxypeptidase/D-alanyl-D-alanine-endopeptidase [Sporosarcina sp. Te-1]